MLTRFFVLVEGYRRSFRGTWSIRLGAIRILPRQRFLVALLIRLGV